MKIITDINDVNQILEIYSGADLQITGYTRSLKKITIKLSKSNLDEVVYLIGVSCESLYGHFYLSEVHLSIKEEYDQSIKETFTTLYDKDSKFKLLTTSGVALARGLESELGPLFNGYLGNKT